MSDFETRVLGYRQILKSQGVGSWRGGLLVHLLLWKVGFRLKPPHYMSQISTSLFWGIGMPMPAAILLLADLTFYRSFFLGSELMLVLTLCLAGFLFGWFYGEGNMSRAVKMGFPRTWEECAATVQPLQESQQAGS